MIDSKYPLHPGQTHVPPLYCKIPLEEHDEMMKKANKADALEIESNRKATNKSEILLETCTYCGRKFPERSMAHIGIGVFKCRECLFGKEKNRLLQEKGINGGQKR